MGRRDDVALNGSFDVKIKHKPYQAVQFARSRAMHCRLGATLALGCVTATLVLLGLMPLLNALLLVPFTLGLIYLARTGPSNKAFLTAVLIPTIVIGFFVAIYRPHGFHYPLIWHADELYPGGDAFSLFINLSKALGGYLVVVWLAHAIFSGSGAPNSDLSRRHVMLVVMGAIASILVTANVVFDVSWHPKLPDGVMYFILVNLFVTVIAEEAFFRVLLQDQISRYFRHRGLRLGVSVGVVSVLFALAHTTSIGPAFALYLFAGFVYAAVYARTQRLWASIGVHFGVNLFHFTLLQYPL